MKKNSLTATGFARVLARGIRANFAPENHTAEIERLAELLWDLAMSRSTDAELTTHVREKRRAESDAEILDAIASELDDMLPTPQPQ